jgi:four helix bundle protein
LHSRDSIHRNIAEGYCRRSIREYLNFLNFALGSLGESVSGIYAYKQAGQIDEAEFKLLDEQAYKLKNGLLRLVESLERKQLTGDWTDTLIVKETKELYGCD